MRVLTPPSDALASARANRWCFLSRLTTFIPALPCAGIFMGATRERDHAAGRLLDAGI
ncbi:hypothetical protein HDE79_000660 [Rhodanobacter sp. MP1X3]|jgi:hypothetical protein|nr:hypothetical protein [Rhodanobacter sp. MP1X3]